MPPNRWRMIKTLKKTKGKGRNEDFPRMEEQITRTKTSTKECSHVPRVLGKRLARQALARQKMSSWAWTLGPWARKFPVSVLFVGYVKVTWFLGRLGIGKSWLFCTGLELEMHIFQLLLELLAIGEACRLASDSHSTNCKVLTGDVQVLRTP